MTETVKKTTTRKPKAATSATTSKAPAKTKAKTSNLSVMAPSAEQIAALAHKYWAERGYQHGKDADDWFRAEQELRSKAS
jgi:ribonuclease I